MAKSAALAPSFPGFERNAMAFWHELAAEMSKEWFVDNKERYEATWVAPLEALMNQVAAQLAPVYKPMKLGAPKAMRIYRDVRFAKDKTPYKTHIAAVLRPAGKPISQMGIAALYVHFGLDEEYTGAGCYFFDPSKIGKWRKAVAGKPGDTLIPLITKLRKAGYTVGGHEDYKRVPTGFAADHPRAAYLKMRGLTCGFPEIPRGLIHKPAFADWLFQHAKASAPLVTWLSRNVG
ncbi:MAG TPA: TIGR02453 family protein [Kofleriaceae bacterium]|nr:TIGR02453 family protein [Kofleriaceae bacterium]